MDWGATMRAMILCAGYGTRLGSLTEELPKPMLPINERPMLEYIIANLARCGFDDIAVNLHFKPQVIREYFGDGEDFGVRITYSYEPELLGTAGGVKCMEEFFSQGDCFLVHYGDVLTNQDFSAMLRFHREKDAMGTLLLHRRAKSNSVVEMDESGRVSLFLERPPEHVLEGRGETWVNSGVCILNREVFSLIRKDAFSDLPRDVFPVLVELGRLYGFPLTGYRCAVDSPKRYEEACRLVIEGFLRIGSRGEEQQ